MRVLEDNAPVNCAKTPYCDTYQYVMQYVITEDETATEASSYAPEQWGGWDPLNNSARHRNTLEKKQDLVS